MTAAEIAAEQAEASRAFEAYWAKPKHQRSRVFVEGGEMTAAEIAAEQAEDEGLWFVSIYASEAYLQAALRRLTAAVEAEAGEIERLKDLLSQWRECYEDDMRPDGDMIDETDAILTLKALEGK